MKRAAPPPNRASRSFQLSRGYRVCISCFHESTVVPTRRCPDCDREVCTLCVVWSEASEDYLCPECAGERQAAAPEPAPPPTKRKRRSQ
jgi:hypothetical protein